MQAASRSWPSLIVFEQKEIELCAGKKNSLDLSEVLMQIRNCMSQSEHWELDLAKNREAT
jgi:hypothetical protein